MSLFRPLAAVLLLLGLSACTSSPEPEPEPAPKVMDPALVRTTYNGPDVELDYSVELPKGWTAQKAGGTDQKVTQARQGKDDTFNEEISVIIVHRAGQTESEYLAAQKEILSKEFEKISFKTWGPTSVGGQQVHRGVYVVTFGFLTLHYELYVWFKDDLAIWLLCGTVPPQADVYAPGFAGVAKTMSIR